MEDFFRNSSNMTVCVEQVKTNPEARALMQERYSEPVIDLEELLQLPLGTLGRSYAMVMRAMKLEPNFYPKREIETDGDWVTMRMRKTHDIHHVITGFAPQAGEHGLLSVLNVQIGYPAYYILPSVTLTRTFKRKPQELARITNQVARGMAMGLQCASLIAQRWEEEWDRPLGEWQRYLGITNPVSEETYSLKKQLSDAF